MKAQQAVKHYKEHGERVDEVLTQLVTEEINELNAVIQQKNFEYDMRTNESATYRAALESIVKVNAAGKAMFSAKQMMQLAQQALAIASEGEKQHVQFPQMVVVAVTNATCNNQ